MIKRSKPEKLSNTMLGMFLSCMTLTVWILRGKVARLYIAMEALCIADNDPAYNLYHEGLHFESDSIFERYKRNDEIPDIDVSAANGNLLAEMKLYNEHREAHPELQPPDGIFAKEPYDDFEELQEWLIGCLR